jgi:hypothetical protein
MHLISKDAAEIRALLAGAPVNAAMARKLKEFREFAIAGIES